MKAKTILDKYFSSARESKTHVGLSFAAFNKGECSYWNYGHSDLSMHRQTTENDFYEVGSVGKIFTALLFATLIRDGKCAATDPIRKFIPELPTGNSMDILQLLTHRAGLPRDPANFKSIAPQNSFKNYDQLQFIEAIKNLDPSLRMASFSYSSFGYLLLGLIAKRITRHQTFSELLQERVLDPLKLTDTKFLLKPSDMHRFNRGHGDDLLPASYLDLGEVYNPAGGLKTTVADLVKFGRYFLEPSLADTSMRGSLLQTLELYQEPDGSQVSFGCHVRVVDGNTFYFHPGHLAGSKSAVNFSTEQKRMVVYCSNTASHVRCVWDIIKALDD